jgi:iron complex outermembrane receptor protein
LALAGVNVLVKGTNTGTSTDFDGNYVLNAEIGDVIIFSYVGFASQDIMYNGEDVINILMSEDASALDEVVLTSKY